MQKEKFRQFLIHHSYFKLRFSPRPKQRVQGHDREAQSSAREGACAPRV